jgi:hypothetical protein
MTVPFTILKDPRVASTQTDFQSQFDFLISVRDKLTETHNAIKDIRDLKKQMSTFSERLADEKGADSLKKTASRLSEQLTAVEEALYQTKLQSPQDPLNYPVRLNNKLAMTGAQSGYGNFRPTDQVILLKKELTQQIDVQLGRLKVILQTDVPAFNKLVKEYDIPAIIVGKKENDSRGTK